jgi:hypothetical protein
MNSTPPAECRFGDAKPSAHSTCFMYCVDPEVPANTGIFADSPPATCRSFAARRARATASPDTVVTPSKCNSGRFSRAASAYASSISVPMSVSKITGTGTVSPDC